MTTFDGWLIDAHRGTLPVTPGTTTAGVFEGVLIEESASFAPIPKLPITPTGLPSTLGFGSASFLQHVTPAIVSHCELGKDRLLEQFKGKPNIENIICKLSDQVQELEQAAADVLAYRPLASAFGALLDLLGENIQLTRQGFSDHVYHVRLTAQTQVIGSSGKPEELLAILLTLDDGVDPSSISLSEQPPACVVLHCTVPAGGQLTGEYFAHVLKQAKGAAIKLILEFEETGVDLFEWDESMTGLGWDEIDGGGGLWAEAV